MAAPRFGSVRCYWSLLVPSYAQGPSGQSHLELKFVYLDPVLGAHLGPQNVGLLNRGLIEFIHPNEREQARNDLAKAIQNDDLQGSVTRIRFARVSHMRRVFGCPPEQLPLTPEMVKVSEDEDYLIIDLVLNWVADGLLLAFFHAVKDMDPAANNDPNRRHEGWSNYCGAGPLPDSQIPVLQQAIATHVTPPPRTRHPPKRVFQLYQVSPIPGQPPILVFSWPPPRPPNSPPGGFDGLYDADEYADLMRGVDMEPSQLAPKPGEMKTNCMMRFGAQHNVRTEGIFRQVSSVFIPNDFVIFACFQMTKLYELPAPATPTGAEWSPANLTPSSGPVRGDMRDWRADYEHAPYPAPPAPQQFVPEYAYHHQAPPPPQHAPHFEQPPQVAPPANSYHPPQPAPQPTAHQPPPPPPPPPSGRGGSTRPLVRPPGDIEKCRGCGTRESPEWRKGENGVKDLCNACGLKLARAVAKREGRQKPRKKDK